ncbi:FAD-dependent pyridine nucleotide-disulfide oxidoreductase [Cellulomonas flavigena DSM 20109]|uniref:FAD-dependent pyridine nucleotide-disulfide oxidoreductase n=1 Tax=Cellulomonas flavigena (strain ATCC 482 / DSM 20109 / BCRC 11376 / JCM 18109 / NBRC 3775 / NCIMB 8073 / NRS 134) TaxID=446466 RepID=D5UL21_CELFN|nr:NAD(P)/FAD-dependent oxidoreductase [Cellulomonas flavigena]ADG75903.1 FAD-dependent pyridine nucleotide-disulfide oxidoreductase [Cellulomonas flavigena DSM 20109]
METTPVDVLVLGGGAAGLAAALTLGRSRRSVRVLDADVPRNATSPHAHNLLTRDGTPPGELLAIGRAEVARYGVEVVTARVTSAPPADDATGEPAFTVGTADGTTHRARRLVLATGMHDVLPDVPGLAERWGRDALHCPYCHGWEVRDRALTVLASGPRAVHMALLVRQLSADVTLLLHDAFEPSADEWADLAARGVRVLPGRVAGVRVIDDALTGVVLADGDVVPCDAVFVGSRAVLDDVVVDGLGLATTPLEHLGERIGRAVTVDPTGATSVTGVWAAGNVTGPQHALAASIAAGSAVGAHVNASLVTSDVARARTR